MQGEWTPQAQEAFLAYLKSEGLSPDGLPKDGKLAGLFSSMLARATPEERAALPLVFNKQLNSRVASILKGKGVNTEAVQQLEAAKAEISKLQQQMEGINQKNIEATLPEGFSTWDEPQKKAYLALQGNMQKQIDTLSKTFQDFQEPLRQQLESEELEAQLNETSSMVPYTSKSLLSAVIAANRDLPEGEQMDLVQAAMHAQAEQITMVEQALMGGDAAYWELVMKTLPKALESKVPQANRLMEMALKTAHQIQSGAGQGGEHQLGGGSGPGQGQRPGETYQEYITRQMTS